jgi:hypothetical protein
MGVPLYIHKTVTINKQFHYFSTDYFKQIPGTNKHCCLTTATSTKLNLYYVFSLLNFNLLQLTAGTFQESLDIPRMHLTKSTIVAGPSLCPCFSATTILDTTGHDSLKNPSSTSKHDSILCGKVPPIIHRTKL